MGSDGLKESVDVDCKAFVSGNVGESEVEYRLPRRGYRFVVRGSSNGFGNVGFPEFSEYLVEFYSHVRSWLGIRERSPVGPCELIMVASSRI